MKKITGISLICMVLLCGLKVYSAGYCPTTVEIQAKSQSWQQRALAGMSSSSSLDDVEALAKEQDAYLNMLVPSCIQYFKTTPNPDCNRLLGLSTGYMLLSSAKQPGAKAQIWNAVTPLTNKCPNEIQALKFIVK